MNAYLEKFYCCRFRFNLKARDDLFFPPYKGFALRGVFGTVLKELCCTKPQGTCMQCDRRDGCAYVYLFETAPSVGMTISRKFSSYPRPYIIMPPLEDKGVYRSGEMLSFEIVLVGMGCNLLPYIVTTFETIGSRGFKRDVRGTGSLGRFTLLSVDSLSAGGDSIIVYRDNMFFNHAFTIGYDHYLKSGVASVSSAVLTFQTPFRFEEDNHLKRNAPDFQTFVTSLARRAVLLSCLHCGGPELPENIPLPESINAVSTTRTDLAWVALERISNRQKARIPQGGMTGIIEYSGTAISKMLPLLKMGEAIHVGKSTTFGLGRYRLSVA